VLKKCRCLEERIVRTLRINQYTYGLSFLKKDQGRGVRRKGLCEVPERRCSFAWTQEPSAAAPHE